MRKQAISQKILSFVSVLVLMAAMALTMTGCGGGKETPVTTTQPMATTTTTAVTKPTATQLGVGMTKFTFQVVDKDGNQTDFEISTDEKTVGEALLNLSLIEGEQQAVGFYVKTVNGITADYDVDRTYWAFYIDGAYAMTGVDATDVVDGATYQFKVEK